MTKILIAEGQTGVQLVTAFNNDVNELYTKSSLGGANVADYGATGDGITDDTIAIQTALTAVPNGGILYFPNGTYMIKSTGDLPDGSDGGIEITKSISIIMDLEVVLEEIDGDKANSQIFYIHDTSNVKISNGELLGDWDTRTTVWEGNHLIVIVDCSNVVIDNVKFSLPSGDCIYCGRDDGESRNITISNCDFTNWRRWGIFADIDENLFVSFCNFHDTLGDYVYGGAIDLEYHGALVGVVVSKNYVIQSCLFDNIGTPVFSMNGGVSISGRLATIEGVKFINNTVVDCNLGIHLAKTTNFIIANNTFRDCETHSINIRGSSTDETYGTITNNSFDNTGFIALGYGAITGYDDEFIKGLIISGNTFNNFIGYCIGASVTQVQQCLFINNIFRNSPIPFSMPITHATQNYFYGNMSLGSDGMSINETIDLYKVTTFSTSRGVTTGDPTEGTYEVGEWLNETGFIAVGYIGRICTVAGTMDTINTVCTANGTAVVIIADPLGNLLSIGMYISINGGAKLQIVSTDGTDVTMSGNVPAGVGVSFVNDPATFKKWGALEP